jgi:hypothetical protein
MTSVLPVSVKVGEPTLSVLIDAVFAFSPLGLLTTMRLARVANVWLPRSLRGILDRDAYYRNRPDQLGAFWLSSGDRHELQQRMAAALAPWQQAWSYGRLSSQVNWLGDARYESVMPDRDDGAMLPRFEACCAALEGRLGQSATQHASVLDDCARDSLALACALQPAPVVILAATAAAGEPPALCNYLDKANIETHRLCATVAPSLLRDLGLIEALLPVIATQPSAALIHLIAPGALSLPDAWSDDDWSIDVLAEPGHGERRYIWDGATALWQPLEACP